MTTGSPALCRLSVHVDEIDMDVAMPTHIPLGVLLPSLLEIAASHGASLLSRADTSLRYLSLPGLPALDSSMSLSELEIADGTVLVLSDYEPPPPTVRAHLDAADLLAPTESGWTPEFSRFAGLLAAVALTAQATFLVVPGASAVPRLLLSAAATAMVCTVATLLTDCGGRTLTVLALVGGFICVTALPATVFDLATTRTAIGLAVVSTVVLSISGRVSVRLAGLGPQPPDLLVNLDLHADDRVRCAHRWLSCLTSAAAICSALSVLTAICGWPPRWPICGLAGAVTAVLLCRAATAREPVSRTCLLAAGVICGAALLLTIRQLAPVAPIWTCLVGLGCAGGALWLGRCGFRDRTSSRGVATAEMLAQASVLPLAAWAFGLYASARGFGPL